MKTLVDKVAVVTGAAMGMGRILSGMLVAEGCRVALVDVAEDALAGAEQELAAKGAAKAYVCDIRDRKAVYDLAARIRDDMGPVSLLVNNAGIMRAAPLLELSDDAVDAMIGVNLTAQFWCAKAFIPQMLEAGAGHVVNVSSAGGLLAIPNLSAYCASKFGVVGFTDALRQEAKRLKWPVTVTCVCPNTVNTGMFDGARMVTGTRMLDPESVCREMLRGIKKDKPYIGVPHMAVNVLTPLTKALLPTGAMDQFNRVLGMWSANDDTHGRADSR
ncbi:MAG: SDR family NAD(P)-dependent oxidoreductase [Desulfatibacillaceae bacterium]